MIFSMKNSTRCPQGEHIECHSLQILQAFSACGSERVMNNLSAYLFEMINLFLCTFYLKEFYCQNQNVPNIYSQLATNKINNVCIKKI